MQNDGSMILHWIVVAMLVVELVLVVVVVVVAVVVMVGVSVSLARLAMVLSLQWSLCDCYGCDDALFLH